MHGITNEELEKLRLNPVLRCVNRDVTPLKQPKMTMEQSSPHGCGKSNQ